MDSWSIMNLGKFSLVTYIVFAFSHYGESFQGGLNGDSDAIIWAVKQYHFFYSPTLSNHFITHKISAFYAPPLQSPQNETLQQTLLFGNIWLGEIWTMFADYGAQRIYYTDHRSNFIGLHDVATNSQRKIFQGLAWGIDSIGVDWISGNVYWTDTNYNWIMVANRNFSHYRNIITINSKIPAKVAVNPIAGHVYWSERQDEGCSIYRCDLQGQNKTLMHNLSYVKIVTSLSIDYARDRLYWTERLKSGSRSSALRYCNLGNPSDTYLVLNSSSAFYEGVTSYKDQLYVTDDYNKRIFIVDKVTNEIVYRQQLGSFMYPRAITAYSDPNHFTNLTYTDVCTNSSCQHLCVADHSSGSYSCYCDIGFQLLDDGQSCGTKLVYDEFALVVDKRHSKLYQVNMESPSSVQDIDVSNIKHPTAVDYDWTRKTVYWADHATKSITKYSLQTKEERDIVNDSRVDSIAVDEMSGNIYFVNSELAALFVTDSEGQYLHTLHTDHIYKVVAMAIDSMRGFIYWTDWGQSDFDDKKAVTGVIRSSRLDGSDVKTIVNSTSTPSGIAMDVKNNGLFWTEVMTNSISWLDLRDGTTGSFILPVRNKNQHPSDLSFWRGRLYIVDKHSKEIITVGVENVTQYENATSEQVQQFGPTILFEASSVHIYSSQSVSNGSNVCANSKCPQLCLPKHDGDKVTAQCVCQDHYTYDVGNNSCVQHASTNDTKPPTFGDTCPDSYSVVISDCMEVAAIQFDIPNATDDSGQHIAVKSMIKLPPMPTQRPAGYYAFHFVASDKSHNKAECRFSIRVTARQCLPLWILNPPDFATVGKRSCLNQVGSKANVTCQGSGEVNYQYECQPNGIWEPDATINCPAPTTSSLVKTTTAIRPTDTTTALSEKSKYTSSAAGTGSVDTSAVTKVSQDAYSSEPQTPKVTFATVTSGGASSPGKVSKGKPSRRKSTNAGLIAGVVIAVLLALLVLVVVVVVMYRRRGIRFFPGTTNWRRTEDRIYLTEGSDPDMF